MSIAQSAPAPDALSRYMQMAEQVAQDAERDRAEIERARRESTDEAFATLARAVRAFITDEVLADGWTIQRTQTTQSVSLVASFLPDDMRLSFSANLVQVSGKAHLALRSGAVGSVDAYIARECDPDSARRVLAPLVAQRVESHLACVRARAAQTEMEERQAARVARYTAKLNEMATVFGQAIRSTVESFAARYSFADHAPIVAYRVEWIEGVDNKGRASRRHGWSLDPKPSADAEDEGVWYFLWFAETVQTRVMAPTITVEEHHWHTIADVPRELTEDVFRRRILRVYDRMADGSVYWIDQRDVSHTARILCPTLRRLVLEEDALIPDDPSPISTAAGGRLVAVLMTDTGFEPFTPDED